MARQYTEEEMKSKKWGHLTVIKRAEDYITPKGHREIRWYCKCDCGNPELITVRGYCLRRGSTTSCGCEQRRLVSERRKGHNTYDLSGSYGIGYDSNGNEFYFDLEDYNKIKNYYWYVCERDKYVVARDESSKNYKEIRMHNLIMDNLDLKRIVDHIKHNNNDNRKSQLRFATSTENQTNKKIQSNNTSGIPGVNFTKHNGKWLARVSVNKKRIHLGYFDRFEDAVKARKEAELKYYGEYRYDYSFIHDEQKGENLNE